MATDASKFTIHFPDWFDERAEWETEAKGWLQGVTVELADGARYAVFFYDPVRLSQDLEGETSAGRPYAAEPGMIVLPQVTRAAINEAVRQLVEGGFFDHLRPLPAPRQNVA
jgi:hypothetical protein